ncbi:alpha-(1,3)-fucosyltransferase fut-5-like [Mya arenaria]|uniref:alpha-(1,3)-fucosyltransferase fut-5-like n=1 Tax=Mya arenaria TaxID=6604 RepID=UPI0022E120C9|nr:alpha-(1,3)-fucosyltransferase fut-5-like [Mya arenaria]XP_052782239.1 alpha-(1,3)-fucosyltransferase fut-5-like [Mya arenaria]XP_052782240.1 alpha-(1,3)-fucosyltransferase fut-5-like [Mya arenaria]XP_052782241.1 alpha-(1,3)-fucosyltransferase fut-5-like [Mya arenaria]XP_052782242.1 alpha-(1,3)-fucosyltransferase fut-5-like [Mya arenaria]
MRTICKHTCRNILILVIATLLLGVFIINQVFNMTGYRYWPTPLDLITFPKHKGLNDLNGDVHSSLDHKRTLVDIQEGMVAEQRSKVNTSSGKSQSILWYKKPNWVSLSFANNALKTVCVYSNCLMTDAVGDLRSHSAIVFTMTQRNDYSPPIMHSERRTDQAWIFFGLESPINHKHLGHRHSSWYRTMNWSMSYRTDADIVYPYGMLVTKAGPPVQVKPSVYKQKRKWAAWIVSNCGADSWRDEFVHEMRASGLQIDVFGRCSGSEFTNINTLRASIEKDYKFYLSFENSLCTDYITEKFFRYYNWEIVLVTRGGANYSELLPRDTFIDSAHYPSAKELVQYLLQVGDSESKYLSYLNNKNKYASTELVPSSFCSICEKVNNLKKNRKTYTDHVSYVHNVSKCWGPSDIKQLHWRKLHVVYGCIGIIIFLFCLLVKCLRRRR